MFARGTLLLNCRKCFFTGSRNVLFNAERYFHKLNESPTNKRLLYKKNHLFTFQTVRVQHRKFYQRRNASSSGVPQAGITLFWSKIFGKYLLLTNILSSGVLMVFGDVIAQEIELHRHGTQEATRYDMKRIARMFVVGALMGPMHHYIYNWMDRIMPVANFRNSIWKILIDQIVMSPACILLFFYSACYMENKTIKETNCELKEKFLYIYFMDWMMWPGAQYINFRYLNLKYRVMFVNVCTALYNIFLSYMKHDF